MERTRSPSRVPKHRSFWSPNTAQELDSVAFFELDGKIEGDVAVTAERRKSDEEERARYCTSLSQPGQLSLKSAP